MTQALAIFLAGIVGGAVVLLVAVLVEAFRGVVVDEVDLDEVPKLKARIRRLEAELAAVEQGR
jgi:hypothetical protein